MADFTVGFGSKTTVGVNWAAHLTAASAATGGTRTINTGITPTITASAGTVTNITPTTTAVLFRFDATAITGPDPVNVTLVITPTYDNGDIDPRWKTSQVTAAT